MSGSVDLLGARLGRLGDEGLGLLGAAAGDRLPVELGLGVAVLRAAGAELGRPELTE